MTQSEFNEHVSTDVPFSSNFTYESEFPDIKPPVTTTGRTRFGDCLVIAGTESFEPITVKTTLADYPTEAGQIIAALAINPQLLAATRLSKLAENYTRWYPRRLVVEYVPQGSALDIGALISIPVMDPEDCFTHTSGNDAIRRALAYEKTVNFNIFDKPQFLLPHTEEDDPFYITSGQNARQEISHVWYCMAQSNFPARSTEEERILGWFKLHYVIELYEPKIPELNVPYTFDKILSSTSVLTFFGPNVANENAIGTSVSLTTGVSEPNVMFEITLTAPMLLDGNPCSFDFAQGTIRMEAGLILFVRLTNDPIPVMRWYNNYSDLFNETNPAAFAATVTATAVTGAWHVRAITSPV